MSVFRAFQAIAKAQMVVFNRRSSSVTSTRCPAGDVLIRVRYSSLNYKDALVRQRQSGGDAALSAYAGHRCRREVVEASSSPDSLPGDEVIVTGYDLGMNTSGGFGQYIRVPAVGGCSSARRAYRCVSPCCWALPGLPPVCAWTSCCVPGCCQAPARCWSPAPPAGWAALPWPCWRILVIRWRRLPARRSKASSCNAWAPVRS